MDTILIFAGGDLPTQDLAGELPAVDLVIAADSGYHAAEHLGYRVDVLVGDMDSIGDVSLPRHVTIHRHPEDKDHTDLDLALELANREQPSRVVVVGGTGGRFDHELSISGLLGAQRWAGIEELDWISPRGRAHVVRGRRILHGDVGATVSLVPIGGPASGITTNGLHWELHGDTLDAGSTRGVSNLMRSPVADIRVETGCLLVVYPG